MFRTVVMRFGFSLSPLRRRLANVTSVLGSDFVVEIADWGIRVIRNRPVVPYGHSIARSKTGNSLDPVEGLTKLRARHAQPACHTPRRVPRIAPNLPSHQALQSRHFGFHSAAGLTAGRFAGFGQRAAASGRTSSIRRRVWAIISSSPFAAGRRMNFETPAAT